MSYTHEELVNSLGSIRVRDMRTLAGLARNRAGCADGLIQFLEARLPEEQFNLVEWDGDKAVAVIRDWLVQNTIIEALDTEDMTTDERCSCMLDAIQTSFTQSWVNEDGIEGLAQGIALSLRDAAKNDALRYAKMAIIDSDTLWAIRDGIGLQIDQQSQQLLDMLRASIPVAEMHSLLHSFDVLDAAGLLPTSPNSLGGYSQLIPVLDSIKDSLTLIPHIDNPSALFQSVENVRQFSDIARIAQTSLAAFEVVNSLGITSPLVDIIGQVVQPTLEAYASLFDLGGYQSSLLLPATYGLFTLADISASLAFTGQAETDETYFDELYNMAEIRDEVASVISKRVASQLEAMYPNMYKMLQGARYALQTDHSENPDKARHFSASVRAIFQTLMHTLAPTEEVEKHFPIESYPKFYHEGRPIRIARLRYICRERMQSEYAAVDTQIKATRDLIDDLSKGDHHDHKEPDFDDKYLRKLNNQAEASLNFYLDVISHVS